MGIDDVTENFVRLWWNFAYRDILMRTFQKWGPFGLIFFWKLGKLQKNKNCAPKIQKHPQNVFPISIFSSLNIVFICPHALDHTMTTVMCFPSHLLTNACNTGNEVPHMSRPSVPLFSLRCPTRMQPVTSLRSLSPPPFWIWISVWPGTFANWILIGLQSNRRYAV